LGGKVRLIAWSLGLAISACATSPTQQSLRITAFSQGLLNRDAAGQPRVYEQGSDFTYGVNGTCVAEGERVPCMWYGFDVSFEGAGDTTVLNCTTDSSHPVDLVDPSKAYGRVSTFKWVLTLAGKSGRVVHPQYISESASALPRTYFWETVCSYQDVEVLRWYFRFRVPPDKAFQRTASLRTAVAERRRWVAFRPVRHGRISLNIGVSTTKKESSDDNTIV
jgi:hypothetical protein